MLTSTYSLRWTPILSNLNPGAVFGYTETNVAATGCRFFQLKSIP